MSEGRVGGSRVDRGRSGWSRRGVLGLLAGFGLAGTALPEIVWARLQEMQDEEITRDVLVDAEKLAGLEFTDPERDLMLRGLRELRGSYERIREVGVGNAVPPAFRFDPVLPGMRAVAKPERAGNAKPGAARTPEGQTGAVPSDPKELAFLPVTRLGPLLRERKLHSIDLTRLYLERLAQLDPRLHCVITRTEELALEQAARADEELDAGDVRGPLHGIPWGAKDLLAARGYRTTWGAAPFRDRVIDEDATVVTRLADAGAVLVAKLTCGALAWGDVWFGEKTRNPWNPEQGSSGSSAGSAAATAAGLVGFAIGTETWGSIVSPATRCGATGLRPTFGRVSRHGCMALSWTMDKIGPLARSVEDCALVLEAIAGADGRDETARDLPFRWEPDVAPADLRIGFVPALFDEEPESESMQEWRRFDREALEVLRGLGVALVPIEFPELPVSALSFILNVEAAAAFDELTRSGRDDELVRQVDMAWPNVFRQSRLVPAVEYIQAQRVRTLVLREMDRILGDLDGWVAPTFGGDDLLRTNLTGHPAVVLPSGFREDGTPVSFTFHGRLFGESRLLALAKAFQETTGYHRRHPELPA